jgi:hypothetical protein
MGNPGICPFYGKNDDYCDVGCEYISPHDVNMIIRFCNGRHVHCTKYMELADRFHAEMPSNGQVLKANITGKMEGESNAVQPYAESQRFSSGLGPDSFNTVSSNHVNKGEER